MKKIFLIGTALLHVACSEPMQNEEPPNEIDFYQDCYLNAPQDCGECDSLIYEFIDSQGEVIKTQCDVDPFFTQADCQQSAERGEGDYCQLFLGSGVSRLGDTIMLTREFKCSETEIQGCEIYQ